MQHIAQITRIIEHLTDNLTFKIEKLIKIDKFQIEYTFVISLGEVTQNGFLYFWQKICLILPCVHIHLYVCTYIYVHL